MITTHGCPIHETSEAFEKEYALICEVEKQNLLGVDALIQSRAHVNFIDREGTTPLDRAVARQNMPIVQRLLEARASPNLGIALVTAVKTRSLELTQLLIKASENLEPILGVQCLLYQKDPFGQTSLMWAVSANDEKMVSLLLDQKAWVNDVDQKKNSALMHAAKSKSSIQIALLLIQAQADVKAKNSEGHNAIFFAKRVQNHDLYALLFSCGARMPSINMREVNSTVHYIKPRPVYDDVSDVAKHLLQVIQPTNPHHKLLYNPFLGDVIEAVESATPLVPPDEPIRNAVIDELLQIVKKKYASVKVFLTTTEIEEVIAQQKELSNHPEGKALDKYDYEEYDQPSLKTAIKVYKIVQSIDDTMSIAQVQASLETATGNQSLLARSVEIPEEQKGMTTPHTLTTVKVTPDIKKVLTYPVVRHRMPGRGATHADYVRLKEAITALKR